MGDFEFGSQEHIDGLSHEALESDFRFVVDRMREAEDEWERLDAENAKLLELLQDYHRYEHEDCYSCRYINECRADESGRCIAPMRLGERYRELGIEVDG